jgi:hypothetical protein
MTMRPGHRLGWAVLTGAVLLAFAAAATASTPKPSRAKPKRGATVAPAAVVAPVPAVTPAPGHGSLGLMAFLDPETGMLTGPIGDLVPPADQRAASANVVLTPMQRANGAWLLDLKGTGMEHYVIQIDPLGNRRVYCVQDPRHTTEFGLLPVAPAGEVR